MLKFFKFCVDNDIPYLATVDSDLKSITPEWPFLLIDPIMNGYDFTTPVYKRNRFEANITNHFAYPIILAVYGKKLRQPLGGEFGYSKSFCEYLLKQPTHQATTQYGIDIFISCNSIAGGFKVKEVYLGKKIHAPSFFHAELTFRQVFESGVFVTRLHLLNSFKPGDIEHSKKSGGIDKIEYFPHKKALPRLFKESAEKFFRYKDRNYYDRYLEKSTIENVAKVIESGRANISDNLWTTVLASVLKKCYDQNFEVSKIPFLSKIMVPIYFWRLSSFWLEVESITPSRAERLVRHQADLLRNKLK